MSPSASASPSLADPGGYAYLSIPILTIDAIGQTVPILSEEKTVEENSPVLTISAEGQTGFMGEMVAADAEIPIITADGVGVAELIGNLAENIPDITIDAILLFGMLISGELDLPPPTISAEGSGTTGDLAVDIPVITIVASSPAEMEIPALTISAGGQTGWLGTASLTLPAPTISADAEVYQTGTADLSIPILTIEGELLVGVNATLEESLPPLEIEASTTYSQNWTGTADLDIPALTINATLDDKPITGTADLSIPALRIDASTVYSQNWTGTLEVDIPVPRITASGTVPTTNTISASLLIPVPQIEATGYQGDNISASLELPAPTLSASGYAGEIGTLEEDIPVSTISASGYPDSLTGTVSVTIPAFTIISSGTSSTEAEPLTVSDVYVVNTNNRAVTEYTNYAFNSYCYFNGIYLGAKSTGIFRLDQEDDAGTDIAMYIEKTKMDLGVAQIKRVTDAYMNVESDGDMDLKMIADDLWYKYRLRNGHSELRREKIDIGKGLKGNHIGFRLDNVRGSDVVLDEILLLVEITSRRIRSASYDS